MKKRQNTLVIIGNGFDIAHKLETQYSDFIKHTSDNALDRFKELCKYSDSIRTWYDFENNISILTEKLFLESMGEGDYFENRKDAKELYDIFKRIHRLMTNYLSTAERKPIQLQQSIARYLNSKAVAINFNYTSTAERYTKNVYHVHGSLAEDDILLGYDYRDEACLAGFEDMCWQKSFCREGLALRRMLRKVGIKDKSKLFKRLESSLSGYQAASVSGRGIDTHPRGYIKDYDIITLFYKLYRRFAVLDIDYSSIDRIVVMGHGIEADKTYLESIFENCNSLKEVVLFKYEGEPKEEYIRKAEFLINYCERLSVEYYD